MVQVHRGIGYLAAPPDDPGRLAILIRLYGESGGEDVSDIAGIPSVKSAGMS